MALENENQIDGTLPHGPTLETRLHMRINAGLSLSLSSPSRIYADRVNMPAIMTARLITPIRPVPNSSGTQSNERSHRNFHHISIQNKKSRLGMQMIFTYDQCVENIIGKTKFGGTHAHDQFGKGPLYMRMNVGRFFSSKI